MTELDKIYELIPDNTEGAVSEKDLRDSFKISFDYFDNLNETKVDGTMKDFLDVFQDATDAEKAQFKDIIGIDGNFNEAQGFDLTLID